MSHCGTIEAIAASRCGTQLATGSVDKTIIVWDAHTGKARLQLVGHTRKVCSLGFSPDGEMLVSGSDDAVRVWDARSGAAVRVLVMDDSSGRAVAWSPDGRRVAVAGKGGSVHILAAGAWELERSLAGSAQIEALAFSPDSTTLAAGGWSQSVHLWCVASGAERLVLRGHRGGAPEEPGGCKCPRGAREAGCLRPGHRSFVLAVCFSPDGGAVASCCFRGECRVWHARTGALRRVLSGARAAAFARGPPRCTERCLAFAMGQHARLGAGSRAAALPADVVQAVLECV